MEDEDIHKDSEVEENERVKTTDQTATNDFQHSGDEEIEAESKKGASCGGLGGRLGGQTGGCRIIIAHNHNGGEVFEKEGGRRESCGRPGDFAGGFTGGGNGDYVGGLNVCAGGLIFVWVKRRRGGRDAKDRSVGCGSGGGPGGAEWQFQSCLQEVPGMNYASNWTGDGAVLEKNPEMGTKGNLVKKLNDDIINESGCWDHYFREHGVQSVMDFQVILRFDKFIKTIGPDPSEPNFSINKKRAVARFIISKSIPTNPANNYESQRRHLSRGNKKKQKRDSITISEVRSTLNLTILTKPTQFSTCDLNGIEPVYGLCDPYLGLLPQVLKPNLAIIVPTQLCANTVTAFTPNFFSIFCNSHISPSTSYSTHFTHKQTLPLDKLLDVSTMGEPLKLLHSTPNKEESKQQCQLYFEDDTNHYCLDRELSANFYPP